MKVRLLFESGRLMTATKPDGWSDEKFRDFVDRFAATDAGRGVLDGELPPLIEWTDDA